VAAARGESNLTVDVNGNPHFFGIFGSTFSTNYDIDPNVWHHALDITTIAGNWISYDVSNILGGSAFYSSSSLNHGILPQISRTADGTKIFFSWTDNSNYFIGSANFQPNLFAKALDVTTLKWTSVKDFSSCNFNTNGKMFYTHTAKEVLEPFANNYKLAPVYAEFTTNQSDANLPSNFRFLDNCIFAASEFSLANNALSVNIIQGSTAILCQGSTINLQINGTYNQIYWSNGNQTNINSVSLPGQYIVTANSGCSSNSDTIVVKTLTLALFTSSANICSGNSTSLFVNSNALSYTWMPGASNSTIITVYPTSTTVYNLFVSGTSCTSSASLSINVSPSPTIVAISNKQKICVGEEVIIQATGANIYVWSTGATASSISVFPNITTVYSLTGLSSLGCSSIYTITQLVDPCTGISSIKNEDNNVLIYPNPNNGNFFVSSLSNDIKLSIYNELGQLCTTISLNQANNFRAEVTNLSSGFYFISSSTQPQLRQKIIVNR
jgi:hypothetical protein